MPLLFPRDFKVQACTVTDPHDERACFGYHSTSDRRRDTVENYMPITCYSYHKNSKKVVCKHGDACMYSHSPYETRYHPLQYKTRMCPYTYKSRCTNRLCWFAHTIDELVDIDVSCQNDSSEPVRDMIEKFTFYQNKSSEKYANDAAHRIANTLCAM